MERCGTAGIFHGVMSELLSAGVLTPCQRSDATLVEEWLAL